MPLLSSLIFHCQHSPTFLSAARIDVGIWSTICLNPIFVSFPVLTLSIYLIPECFNFCICYMPFLLPEPHLLRIILLVPINNSSAYACVMQDIANNLIVARWAQQVNWITKSLLSNFTSLSRSDEYLLWAELIKSEVWQNNVGSFSVVGSCSPNFNLLSSFSLSFSIFPK